MTSKEQITIPNGIREKLDLTTGDRLWVEVKEGGTIELRKVSAVERIRQTLGAELRRRRVAPEELDQLIEETRSALSKELYDDPES